MNFAELQRRLIVHLQARLRNGEWTERGLARQVGISQPHMHNVLRGVRLLTPEVADIILLHLGLDLLTLSSHQELERAAEECRAGDSRRCAVPLAPGELGPGSPWPDLEDDGERVRLPVPDLASVVRPVLVRLGADEELGIGRGERRVALLDLGEQATTQLCEQAWYALCVDGHGYVRQVRPAGEGLLIKAQIPLLPGDGTGLEHVFAAAAWVKARVVWVGADPRGGGTLNQSGFLGRAAIS
jgi:hypothetical protein